MLLIIFALLSFLIFFPKISVKTKVVIATLLVGVFIVFAFGLGTDYFSYEYLYENMSLTSFSSTEKLEVGYSALVYLSKSLGINYHTFSILIKLFIFALVQFWIFNSSENPMESVLIFFSMFFIVWTMSALRQGIVLAIGLNLLYNKKYTFKLHTKVLGILFLSLFHISSLFLFVFLVADFIKWTRKKHLILLSVGLISTFLPLGLIISKIPIINTLAKFESYASSNFGFFDISSLMRLMFFILVFAVYSKITTNDYDKKITDTFLVGASLYFIFKFSEIMAGRFTIYSFVLLVIILPKVIDVITQYVKEHRTYSRYSKLFNPMIMASLLVVFSFFMFTKEVVAYRDQVGYEGPKPIYGVHTILEKNYHSFDNIYSYRVQMRSEATAYHDEFKKNISNIPVESFQKDSTYFSVYNVDSKKYSLLSNHGNFLDYPDKSEGYSVFSNVMVETMRENAITNRTLVDISGVETDQSILAERIGKHHQADYEYLFTEEVLENLKFEDVISNPEDFVPFKHNIGESKITKVSSENFSYHLLEFKYYHYTLYIYLTPDLVPYSNLVHTSVREFNRSGYVYATSYYGTVIYNSDGKVIWAS